MCREVREKKSIKDGIRTRWGGIKLNKDPFKEYIRKSEPDKREKGYAWHTAIGLQAVDGLKTSEYLKYTAVRNIEGEISFDEANKLLQLKKQKRTLKLLLQQKQLLMSANYWMNLAFRRFLADPMFRSSLI